MEHDDRQSTSWASGRGRVPRLAAASVLAYATLPYAGFLAANIGGAVDHRRVAIYWAGTSVAALLPVLLSALLEAPATARRLAVVTSALLFLFFNYPMVQDLQNGLGVDVWLHPAGWALVTAVVVSALLFAGTHRPVQTFVALLGLGMLTLPLGQLALALPTLQDGVAATEAAPAPAEEPRPQGWTPNVYYFVPDGYAGLDVVERISGLETDPFAAALEARGLTVSPDARANYPTTYSSLSSTLQMEYLIEDGESPEPRELSRRLRGENRVVAGMRERGYRYVHAFPGAWRGSRCSGAEDLCLGDGGLGETDSALLALTPVQESGAATRLPLAALAESTDPAAVVERARFADTDPTFLFMHLLAPHPPFMWKADCSVREDVDFDLGRWADDERRAYGESVACLNGRLLEAIDAILASDDDPIIIIQADHGSAFSFTWELSGDAWLEEGGGRDRLSILSAVRLPRACDRQEVPADLTPVNTFRIVFSCIDGTEPDLLPNRSFLFRYGTEPAELLSP